VSGAAQSFDVIIVGGGIVGATTACALGRNGLRVALVEQRLPDTHFDAVQFDLRASAITQASERIFDRLGAWSGMRARRVSVFREMQVWDEAGSGAIHFSAADIDVDHLGHIVENRVMQVALLDVLRTLPGVQLLHPATPRQLRVDNRTATLTLDDGRALSGAVIVGSDGRDSWVRQQVGIAYRAVSYEQSAVVGNITTTLPHRQTAWQRFTADGPVAMLPLVNGQSSLVWSVPTARAEALLQLDDAAFLRELNNAFGDALGALRAVGPRAAFALQRAHAGAYVSERVALVGDAAHSIHPLAGQGVNMGLLDAAALAEVILNARRDGRDPGDRTVLRRFERWRKGHNVAMQSACDGLKRLFGSTNPALVWARNTGLRLTDHVAAVKNLLALHAVGNRGDLPALARREAVSRHAEIR
jgi:2-octaprenylphenol hydroxylase